MRARFVIVSIIFLAAAPILSAQEGIPSKKVQYQDVQTVKVSYDPHAVLSRNTVRQIVDSAAVRNQAVRDINGKAMAERLEDDRYLVLNGEKVRAAIQFAPDDDQQILMTGGTTFGSLHAFLSTSDKPLSQEADYRRLLTRYIEVVRKRCEETLDAVARREFEKHLKRQAQSVAQERELAERAVAQVRDKREVLRKTAAGLPQSVLEESLSNLQKQHQALELEIVGLKGRAEAITEQVRHATDELKKAGPDDEVVRHLERVLAARMDQFKNLRKLHEQGSVSAAELSKAEENIALAQVEIVQAKRQVGKGHATRIENLNAELVQIAVAHAEARAKSEYVSEELAKAQELLKTEINTAQPLREEITAEAAAAQEMAIEARKREAELRRLEASYRPASVEVFDVKPPGGEKPDAAKAEAQPKSDADAKSRPK
jgi:chromosome segregation ATPase